MEIDNELVSKIKITPILDSLKLEDISDSEYFSERFSGYISNSRLGNATPYKPATISSTGEQLAL